MKRSNKESNPIHLTQLLLGSALRLRAMDQRHQEATPIAVPEHFRTGVEDIVILPLVVIALAVVMLLKGFFTLLIRLIDFLFPILLQLIRFPLFTLRILGDGVAALTNAIVAILPIGGTRRAAWR